jgi:hypothetical protein
MIKITRTVYWNKQVGSDQETDHWLGIIDATVSISARELCCRAGLHSDSFARGAENLYRLGQIKISSDTLRKIIESEGNNLQQVQASGYLRPDWQASDCKDTLDAKSMITVGVDGVMVPAITEAEKKKRQENYKNKQNKAKGAKKRKRKTRRKKGSDNGYKEFKLVTFYNKTCKKQYVVGTSGDHNVLGRIMRREAAKIGFDKAARKNSITDGATWITEQLRINLPMLDAMTLDYYHLSEHISDTAKECFGQGSPQAAQWRDRLIDMLFEEEGPVNVLTEIGLTRKSVRANRKREALRVLAGYVGKRLDMIDYSKFIEEGYDIGSGPTEAMCKCLTRRLKGSGMKWDVHNAQACMNLIAIQHSNMWDKYWNIIKNVA